MNWALGEDDLLAKRWRRRLLWSITILALGLVIAVIVFRLTFSRAVARQIAAIRARGEPVTYAELDAMHPPLPAGEDATQLWLAAARKLAVTANVAPANQLSYIGDDETRPSPGQPWEKFAVAQQVLATRSAELEQLHAAARRGGRTHLPIDFNVLLTMSRMVDWQQFRACARWIALEANVRAYAGDASGSAESLRAGLILAHALEDEPIIISQLVRMAIHGIAVGELLRLMPVVDFSDNDLERLGNTLESLDFRRGFNAAIVGERVYGISVFENPAAYGLPATQRAVGLVMGGSDESLYLELMSEYVAASELPWPQLVNATDAVSVSLRNRLGYFDFISQTILGPQFVWRSCAKAETRNRLAILAVAAERYRRREARPPAHLAALVPEYIAKLPDDPTNGKPFSYRATETEYVVYSPTKMFGLPANQQVDEETGANPQLLFRWPAPPEKVEESPAVQDEATTAERNGTPAIDE